MDPKKNFLASFYLRDGFHFFLIFFQLFFSLSTYSEEWQTIRSHKDNLTLSLKANSSVYASITRSKSLYPKGFDSQPFSFTEVEKAKRKILSLIQIREWKSDSYQWKTRGDKGELYINGSYLNYKNERQYFQEFHIYSTEFALQILVTASSLKELKLSKPEILFNKARAGKFNFLNE
ncbi:MAG: hypothetical protein OXJ52_09020 [Oligoflexia bacterium]|nr:hypothetical protein [Oligoflexia bacterium]